MRRTLGSRIFLLAYSFAVSTSISGQGTTVNCATQSDGLDRIFAAIPTRNKWARWGMDWARWGSNFARMLPPLNRNLHGAGASPYYEPYPQSANGGIYAPKLPYNRQQPIDGGFYPGASPYDHESLNGSAGRYPYGGRRPPSSSYYRNPVAAYDQPGLDQPYYQNRLPRTLPPTYYGNDVRSPPEHDASITESGERKPLVAEAGGQEKSDSGQSRSP